MCYCFGSFFAYLSIWLGTSPGHASVGVFGVQFILLASDEAWHWSSSVSSFTLVGEQRRFRTMYLYFFQLQAFGSGVGVESLWNKMNKIYYYPRMHKDLDLTV